MRSAKGLLIAVEGIECVGKTPMARMLTSLLVAKGYDAVYTYEPTNGPYGKLIRFLLRRIMSESWRWERALLFALDRAWHVSNVITPLLKRDVIIVCDRYIHSQLAYQAAEGLPMDFIEELNMEFPLPDMVIFLDSNPKYVIERLSFLKRKGNISKSSVYDNEAFLSAVRSFYLKYLRDGRFTKEYFIIDIDKEIGRGYISDYEFDRKMLIIAKRIVSFITNRVGR